jgi:hypothetical protein
MKMKKIIFFLFAMVLIVGCSKQPYYEIPKDANGNVILTGISSCTTTGISVLDDQFSVTATLPNAKAGDVMKVELLQLQLPSGSTTTQLLPLAGTQKQVTVGADLKATVTYTRAEAKLNKVGDYVTVTYSGATDYALQRVNLVAATTVSKPQVDGINVDVARTAETAYFNVTVVPKSGAYTGTLVAQRKNGTTGAWVNITPSATQPYQVPIAGTDFAVGKDTMFYSFSAASGAYTDVVLSTIIVRDPYFFLKKSATLTLGGNNAINPLINAALPDTDPMAMIAASSSLILQGGTAWLAAGNSITFVPTTLDMYTANKSTDAIAAFAAGVPTTTADPIAGTYIFKIVNGPAVTDVYYGMLKVTSVIPGTSISIEYRIGNLYAHLSVIK